MREMSGPIISELPADVPVQADADCAINRGFEQQIRNQRWSLFSCWNLQSLTQDLDSGFLCRQKVGQRVTGTHVDIKCRMYLLADTLSTIHVTG